MALDQDASQRVYVRLECLKIAQAATPVGADLAIPYDAYTRLAEYFFAWVTTPKPAPEEAK